MNAYADISVIIPVYNAQGTIAHCLDSILAQTMPPKEIIVVNDGSADTTSEVIAAYVDKHPDTIRLISQHNSGPSAARNKGLDAATAKYIAFVDSDDDIDPTMYEKMYQSALENDSDLIACGRTNFDKKTGLEIKTFIPAWDVINGSLQEQPQMVRRTGNIMCDKLFRRSIIEEHHIRQDPKIHHAEDFLFISEFRLYCERYSAVQEPLYHYYLNSGSSISSSNQYIADMALASIKVIEMYSKHGLFEATKPYLEYVIIGFYLRKCRDCDPHSESFLVFKSKMCALFKTYFKDTWKKAFKRRVKKIAEGEELERILGVAFSSAPVNYYIENYHFKTTPKNKLRYLKYICKAKLAKQGD